MSEGLLDCFSAFCPFILSLLSRFVFSLRGGRAGWGILSVLVWELGNLRLENTASQGPAFLGG